MSDFFWNIRGFNKESKHLVVKDWIRKNGFQFGCIIGTRVKENKVKNILEKVVPVGPILLTMSIIGWEEIGLFGFRE